MNLVNLKLIKKKDLKRSILIKKKIGNKISPIHEIIKSFNLVKAQGTVHLIQTFTQKMNKYPK